MDQYVTYNNDYHVLICRQHAFGLSPDYVERHFQESQQTIPIEIRKKIVHYSKTLDLWQSERVNNIAPTFVPIQGLHIISGLKYDYFDCKELRADFAALTQAVLDCIQSYDEETKVIR